MTRTEEILISRVDEYLARGVALKKWWDRVYPANSFKERFELGETLNRPDTSFGFFDQTAVAGADMPVMGNFQAMRYDQPKSPARDRPAGAAWMRDQMREFVLRYFMRVSDFRQPEAYEAGDTPTPPIWLRPVSLCPEDVASKIGFGFTQLLYKRADTGEIGRFSDADRFAIVDLREIGPTYEWIVVKVGIFDFSFSYKPLGAAGPELKLPLSEASYLVLSRDFISNEDEPSEDELGRYGIGYAFIKNPEPGLLGYGPGDFEAAIKIINFHVYRTGRVRVKMIFVANRPQQIMNLSLDPIDWGYTVADWASGGAASRITAPIKQALAMVPGRGVSVDPVFTSIGVANLLSFGAAGRELCISRRTLEIDFLVKHFMQHYQTVAGSLQTWRQIPDWLDEGALPSWVKQGLSS